MIRVHHLQYSRSTRILWLLEEIGQPYEMIVYERDPKTMRAPDSLKAAHPLGKAPVIEDGGRTIAESGAIIEYLVSRYAEGKLGPAPADADWPAYIEWLHFGEGTAMMGLILALMGGRDGLSAPAAAYAEQSRNLALDEIARGLGGRDYLVGDGLTGADIQIFYVLDFAIASGLLGDRPTLADYHRRLSERPAFVRAIEKGGPVALPRRPAR